MTGGLLKLDLFTWYNFFLLYLIGCMYCHLLAEFEHNVILTMNTKYCIGFVERIDLLPGAF